MWPKVNGISSISSTTTSIGTFSIQYPTHENQKLYWNDAYERFIRIVVSKLPTKSLDDVDGKAVEIKLTVRDNDLSLKMGTDESSKMSVSVVDDRIEVTITANTYYGARHALESLSQFIQYDELHDVLILPSAINVEDKPAYKYRGFLLDTARRFYSIDSIKRTIGEYF